MKTSKRNLAALAVALLLWLNAALGSTEEALTAEDYYRTAVTEFGDDPYTGAEKDGAITLYTRAIKVDPTYHAAYNARGHMYALLDEYPQAIKDYSKAIELDPSQAEYWYNRGTIYGYIALYQEAARDLDQALAINPRHAAAYYERGAVRYGLGEKAAAKQDYEKAVQLNPRYNGYGNYGNILKELKYSICKYLEKRAWNYAGAEVYQSSAAFYEIIDRLKPLTPRTYSSNESYHYVDRAKVYSKVGQYQRAIDVCNIGLKSTSDFPYPFYEFMMWRGTAYAGLGNKAQAYQDFEEADKAYKGNPELYFLRGKCYEKFGDFQAALASYQTATKVGGGGGADFKSGTYCHLGRLYHKLGNYAAARQAYERAVEIIKEDQDYYVNEKKKTVRLNIVPGILVSWEYYYWGEALEYLGQYEEAKARYQSAFKSNREIKPYVPQKYWLDLESDGLPIRMGGDLH